MSRYLRIEAILLLSCWILLCRLSEAGANGPRGYRRTRGLAITTTEGYYHHRALMMDSSDEPTSSPTYEPDPSLRQDDGQPVGAVAAAEKKKEETKEEEELQDDTAQALEKDKDKEAGETVTEQSQSPSITPTDAPITPQPTLVAQAIEVTVPPGTPIPATNPPTMAPLPEPDTISSTPAPTMLDAVVLEPPTAAQDLDNNDTQPTTLPYYVRLEPLYMTVSLTEGDFSEAGFMEVLVDYMSYNMARDIDGFVSITYGISTFSQTTAIPGSTSRNSNGTAMGTATTAPLIKTNITVHVHLLTSTFDGKPKQPDLVVTEYMEMLLENQELFQQYIDMQPRLDAQIYSISLEFEETIQPTNVQDNTEESNSAGSTAQQQQQDEETPRTDEEKANSVWRIVGITMGCFCVLLWVVYLHGIQSRPINT